MKISDKTLAILKNFSGINSGIVIPAGSNVLRSMSSTRSIFASANVDETFDTQVCIYDLSKFISQVSLFEDPDFQFSENKVVIKGPNGQKVNHGYSMPDLIAHSTKDLEMPSCEVEFELSAKNLDKILKASSIIQVDNITITNIDGEIVCLVHNIKNSDADTFQISLGKYTGSAKFEFNFKAENFKMMEGDYTVQLSSKKISKFNMKDDNIVYFLAIESSSSYSDE